MTDQRTGGDAGDDPIFSSTNPSERRFPRDSHRSPIPTPNPIWKLASWARPRSRRTPPSTSSWAARSCCSSSSRSPDFSIYLGGDDQSALERLMNIAVIYIVFLSAAIVILLAAATIAFVFLTLQLRDKALPAMDELTAHAQAGARHHRVHERGSGQAGDPGRRQGGPGGRDVPGLPQRQQAALVSEHQLIRPVRIEEAAAPARADPAIHHALGV